MAAPKPGPERFLATYTPAQHISSFFFLLNAEVCKTFSNNRPHVKWGKRIVERMYFMRASDSHRELSKFSFGQEDITYERECSLFSTSRP